MIKLLIADDERASRMGVRYAIDWAAHGIEVVGEAGNGQEALAIVKEYLPDILVTDIRMPVMDGLELARIVRSFLPNIYIIMLSGYADAEYMQRAIEVGANEYIFKSADSSNILNTVLKGKAFIERKREHSISDTLQKSVWNDSFPAIRNDFFRRAMTGEVYSENLRKAARALDVVLDGPRYLLALFCTEEESPEAMGSRLNVRLSDFATMMATPEKHLLVCVVNLPEEAEEVPAGILAIFKEAAAGKARVLLSTILRGFAQLTGHWPALRQLADSAFWFELGQVMHQEALQARRAAPEALEDIERRFLDALYRREQRAAMTILEEFLEAAQAACMSLVDFRAAIMRALTVACTVEHALEGLHGACAALAQETVPGNMLDFVAEVLGIDSTETCKEIIINAIRYIDQHYAQRIGLTQIAENIFVSPNYLSQVFRSDMGIGIREYIARKRIDEAQKMLADGELKYYEIAVKVGYRDYKHFSEQFLQYSGMSARQFQQSIIRTAGGAESQEKVKGEPHEG